MIYTTIFGCYIMWYISAATKNVSSFLPLAQLLVVILQAEPEGNTSGRQEPMTLNKHNRKKRQCRLFSISHQLRAQQLETVMHSKIMARARYIPHLCLLRLTRHDTSVSLSHAATWNMHPCCLVAGGGMPAVKEERLSDAPRPGPHAPYLHRQEWAGQSDEYLGVV